MVAVTEQLSSTKGLKPIPVPSLFYNSLTHKLPCLIVLQCTEKLKMVLGIRECNAIERELGVLAHA